MSVNQTFRLNVTLYAVSILGCLLVISMLVKAMQRYTRPSAVNAARVAERTQALAEQRALEADAVYHYGVVDEARHIFRLPVSNAMEITIQEYRNPGAARSNLLARLEKATAPLPKAPPPKNPYE